MSEIEVRPEAIEMLREFIGADEPGVEIMNPNLVPISAELVAFPDLKLIHSKSRHEGTGFFLLNMERIFGCRA